MTDVNISDLLSQIQRLAAQANQDLAVTPLDGAAPGPGQQGFAELLRASIDGVNEAQLSAAEIAEAFERGDANVDLPDVMIALQKASLAFQAMTEVRNQLVSAYQDVMNMPI